MNVGSIQGGTNAGWRRVRPKRDKRWECDECGEENEYSTRCISCSAPRPRG